MRKSLAVALIVLCTGSIAACRSRETSAQTGTISPATPEQRPTTTDAVTTQTVDVSDTERSPAEGAGATETTDTTATTTTRRPRSQ